jgi:hypothetical protein
MPVWLWQQPCSSTTSEDRHQARSCIRQGPFGQVPVKGIQLRDGTEHLAEVVLVSGDARGCFFGMIGRDKLPPDLAGAIDAIPLVESVHTVHLGVDMDPTPHQGVPLNCYYGTYDIEDSVHKLRSGAYHHGEADLREHRSGQRWDLPRPRYPGSIRVSRSERSIAMRAIKIAATADLLIVIARRTRAMVTK